MSYTADDVQTLIDIYTPDEIRSRLRFLVEMRNKGISSDSYQGNQVIFRSRADLTEEIRIYRAAVQSLTNGTPPSGSLEGFRILNGWGRRHEDYER